MSTAAVSQRFWTKVRRTEDCWHWIAGISTTGYGHFWLNGRTVVAHRYAYEVCVGPIPDGLVLDHLCRNRACVRPEHLEPVTQRDNTIRGLTQPAFNAQKDQCPAGHPYSGDNLRVTNGRRVCRACHRVNAARSRARRAA